MADTETVEFFARLAYMSALLAPDAPKNPPHWNKLPELERQRYRDLARAEVESVE